jgi:hypothetical protein
VIIFAPWRMMPRRSTWVPIMNPGTSARNTSGMLNASQHQTKRAALSAVSVNSTPPLTAGLLATNPTGGRRQAEPDDQLRREQRLDLEEALGVDERVDDVCMSYRGLVVGRHVGVRRRGGRPPVARRVVAPAAGST